MDQQIALSRSQISQGQCDKYLDTLQPRKKLFPTDTEMANVLSQVEDAFRIILILFYFTNSLCAATLILLYASLFGSANTFAKRVRSLISVVTCAPWLLCFGIRLAIMHGHLVYGPTDSPRTVNIGTHASHIDGLSMMVAYWRNRHRHLPPCAIVKREVLFTPFYGPFAFFVGNVLVARGSTKEAAIESMSKATQRMKEGYVVGAFPEGSRRRAPSTGKEHLMPFKKGIFHMVHGAVASGTPVTIAPFCLVGSRSAWPTGRLIPVPRSKVLLRFCQHVQISPKDSVETIQEKTLHSIEKGLESVCRNEKGEYDIDQAFARGVEVDLGKEFLFEAILLTFPSAVTVLLLLLGRL